MLLKLYVTEQTGQIFLEYEQNSLLFYSIFSLSFRVAGFVFTLDHVMS